ncbi:3263_t:CDS:2 [Dentiscutata erythropus]|uniref:non-specific serine/threonine protein kinase n=1 Tax=Dentiscutata erythropus TaxID=1348616 RepID=A0A9N9FTD5_9GLOM|nr:3263_t:CDS:2 [Dentiscutata erythropus]
MSSNDLLSAKRNNGETNIEWIKRMIEDEQICSIDHSEFGDPVHVRYGGSGVVTRAQWKKRNKEIILKQIVPYESALAKSENQELAKELKAFHSIKDSLTSEIGRNNVIEFLGVSINKGNFFLVLEYADLGNLRDYLMLNKTLDWERRINIVRQVTCGLYFLHKNEILHRDLHIGNVVIKSDKNSKFDIKVLITDFGVSKVITRQSVSSQAIKGCITFMDPFILNALTATYGEKYNYPSDIYSLGMTMYAISNDKLLADENIPVIELVKKINGIRENPMADSTQSYVDLYTKCMDDDPNNRPTIEYVYDSIHKEEIISGKKWGETIQSQ